MNIFKAMQLIEKVRKHVDIRFLQKEEAINHKGISIYTENGIPKGIFIPFSELDKLKNILEEIMKKEQG